MQLTAKNICVSSWIIIALICVGTYEHNRVFVNKQYSSTKDHVCEGHLLYGVTEMHKRIPILNVADYQLHCTR